MPTQPGENQYHGAGGGDGILVVTVFNPELRKYEGLTLSQIGKQLGKDPRDVAMDIVAADRALTRAVNFVMSEDDVRATLKHPLVSVGTDSAAKAEDGPLAPSKSHPRGWGSFARILASTSKPLTRWEQEEPGETSIPYGSENAKMPLPAGMTIICFPPASKLIGLEDMVPPS